MSHTCKAVCLTVITHDGIPIDKQLNRRKIQTVIRNRSVAVLFVLEQQKTCNR